MSTAGHTVEPFARQAHALPLPMDIDDGNGQGFAEEAEGFYSDADSDVLEWQADVARLDASVAKFVAEQRGLDPTETQDDFDLPLDPALVGPSPSGRGVRGRGRGRGRGRPRGSSRGRPRGQGRGGKNASGDKTKMASSASFPTTLFPSGPASLRKRPVKHRRPAELTGDLKHLMSHATEAFLEGDFERCMAQLFEIIRVNAEVEPAWRLLSNVLEKYGRRDEAVMSLMYAAHLDPKNAASWVAAAELALDGVDLEEGSSGAGEGVMDREKRRSILNTAMVCYAAASSAEPRDVKIRMAKADVLLAQGNVASAVKEYQRILVLKPHDIFTVRNMSDAAIDVKENSKAVERAKAAYQQIIEYALAGGQFEDGAYFMWSDIRVYLLLFEALEQWEEALLALRALARWLLGRQGETYWDRWTDDREWDRDDDFRRMEVPDFEPGRYAPGQYGQGLPIDLRAKLFIYRSKMGVDFREVELHKDLLDEHATLEDVGPFSNWLRDVGDELFSQQKFTEAARYYETFRRVAAEDEAVTVEPEMLVSQGLCYIANDDKAAAEECFIDAIEADEDNIDARFELAKMYEGPDAGEAFILVNEALALEAEHEVIEQEDQAEKSKRLATRLKDKRRKLAWQVGGDGERKVQRRRRLLVPRERQLYEEDKAEGLKEKYRICQELREQIVAGDEETTAAWMTAAKDLVGTFRSFKDFYPWQHYLSFLGYSSLFNQREIEQTQQRKQMPNNNNNNKNNRLEDLAERLKQNLLPKDEGGGTVVNQNSNTIEVWDHRGIPFDEWLNIFLEYALALSRAGQGTEAYEVLSAARDSVAYKSKDNSFLIHIAWAACALNVGDELTSLSVARFLIKEQPFNTDGFRLYAAMSRLCQAPTSWFSSGPEQKFVLRHVKLVDSLLLNPPTASGDKSRPGRKRASLATEAPPPDQLKHPDVALLVLYGHILYVSGSYIYALNYYMRALSIDPQNPLILLSAGISYVHIALKRQSSNRQYLIMQGFALLTQYHRIRAASDDVCERQEANYNLARAYHVLGLVHLAMPFYRRVLEDEDANGKQLVEISGGLGREDLVLETAMNLRSQCLIVGDIDGARTITERYLVV